MDLRPVNVKSPVKVFGCHLRFTKEDQFTRRSHLLVRVDGKPIDSKAKHDSKVVYRLDGETMFKAGESFDTDFVFPKAMRDQAEYADEPAVAESAEA